jgi:arsenate reductase
MAEVILNTLGKGQCEAVSAGAKPSGYVHPMAIETLKERHMSTEGLRSKSWEEFKDQAFDVIITVCDNAKESCPIFQGNAQKIHWSIQDPADATGTDEEKQLAFNRVFNELQQRIRLFSIVAAPKVGSGEDK